MQKRAAKRVYSNSRFIKIALCLLAPIAIGSVSLLNIHDSPTKEFASASYTHAKLPTTIDLNAVEASTIRNYYACAQGKNGDDLLKALKPILMNNQQYFKYDGSDDMWKMYEITDRDWNLSPASSMKSGTYDPQKNIITNYIYENKDVEDPYVRALYVNRDASNPKKAWESHGQRANAASIEREHIWPKSHGFDEGTAAGARGDPMHLWPADAKTNGIHNNYFYAFVDKTKTYSDAGDSFSFLKGNLLGVSKTLGGTIKVFEPQDSDKGDIARACFYMVARYNNLANNDSDISAANPNLALSFELTASEASGTSTSTQAFSLGLAQDLLEWNRLDPVDDFEIQRNDILFKNYTKNRNPFIDFPQWADMIWGGVSSTAQPSTDIINGDDQPVVRLQQIEVTTNPNKTEYDVGEYFDPTGMVVSACYSDGSKTAITNYTISVTSALTAKDTKITISYLGFSTTLTIKVGSQSSSEESWELVTEEQDDWSGKYILGSSSADGTIKILNPYSLDGSFTGLDATLEDGILSGENVSEDNALVVEKSQTAGKYTVKAGDFYIGKNANSNGVDSNKTYSTNLDNTIIYDTDRIKISGNGGRVLTWYKDNSNFRYYAEKNNTSQLFKKVEGSGGGTIHPTGVSISKSTLTLEEGYSETITATVQPADVTDDAVVWSSSNDNVATVNNGRITAHNEGTATITAAAHDTVGNFKATCVVTVTPGVKLTSLTLSGNYQTSYFKGEELNTDGLLVTAHYTKSGEEVEREEVSSDCTFSGYNPQTTGIQTVTVSYGGINTTYNVNVSATPTASVYESGQAGWTLVNSESQLTAGSVYTLGCPSKNNVALPAGSYAYFPTETDKTLSNASFTSTSLIPNEGVSPLRLTLGGSKGAWTLTDDIGLVGASAAKAIQHNDGTTTWTISFDGNVAIIKNTTEANGWFQYNASSPRFLNYSSNQTAISLYKYSSGSGDVDYEISAQLARAIFIAQEKLDSECSILKVTTSTWADIKDSITPFLVDTSTNDFKALMFGKAKSSQAGGNMLEDFLKRYDEIVLKYHYEAFIKSGSNSRVSSQSQRTLKQSSDSDYIFVTIIGVSISLVFGCCFYSKKRKEQNA